MTNNDKRHERVVGWGKFLLQNCQRLHDGKHKEKIGQTNNYAIDSCKNLQIKLKIPMMYAGTDQETKQRGTFNQTYDRISTCFGNILGSEFKKHLSKLVRNLIFLTGFNLHEEDNPKSAENCISRQILGLYFVCKFESTTTIEAVDFIKHARDELLGINQTYKEHIHVVSDIRAQRGKKDYSKLVSSDYHWIDCH